MPEIYIVSEDYHLGGHSDVNRKVVFLGFTKLPGTKKAKLMACLILLRAL
jgi:hypothetical protein